MPITYMVDNQGNARDILYTSKAEVPNTGINGRAIYSHEVMTNMYSSAVVNFGAVVRTAGTLKVRSDTFVKDGQLKSRYVLSEGVFNSALPATPFTHNALVFQSGTPAESRVFGFTMSYENISGDTAFDEVYGILSIVHRTSGQLAHIPSVPKFKAGVDYSIRVVQTPIPTSSIYSAFTLYINGVQIVDYQTYNTEATTYGGIAAGAKRGAPLGDAATGGTKLFDLVNCTLTVTDMYMNIVQSGDADKTLVHGHIDVNHVSPESYTDGTDWKVVDGTSLQSEHTDVSLLEALQTNNTPLADADKRMLTPGRSNGSIDLHYNYRSADLIAAQVAIHHTPPSAGLGRLKIESMNTIGDVINTMVTPATATVSSKYLTTQSTMIYPIAGQSPENYAISTVRISRE